MYIYLYVLSLTDLKYAAPLIFALIKTHCLVYNDKIILDFLDLIKRELVFSKNGTMYEREAHILKLYKRGILDEVQDEHVNNY